MPAGEKEIEVNITGHVQDVNFRSFITDQATELGVTGFVRNRSDGSVEVVAQGDEDELKALIEQFWKGPPFARVEDVDVRWHQTPQDSFTSFSVEETV